MLLGYYAVFNYGPSSLWLACCLYYLLYSVRYHYDTLKAKFFTTECKDFSVSDVFVHDDVEECQAEEEQESDHVKIGVGNDIPVYPEVITKLVDIRVDSESKAVREQRNIPIQQEQETPDKATERENKLKDEDTSEKPYSPTWDSPLGA